MLEIESLVSSINDHVVLIQDENNIQQEVTGFYKKLLSSSAHELKGIRVDVLRNGSQLATSDVDMLINEVIKEEIDLTLRGIRDDKAPGIDVFNAYLFKQA